MVEVVQPGAGDPLRDREPGRSGTCQARRLGIDGLLRGVRGGGVLHALLHGSSGRPGRWPVASRWCWAACGFSPPGACCATRPAAIPATALVFKVHLRDVCRLGTFLRAGRSTGMRGEWTAMLLLLCTAALAGGASSSLAPDLALGAPLSDHSDRSHRRSRPSCLGESRYFGLARPGRQSTWSSCWRRPGAPGAHFGKPARPRSGRSCWDRPNEDARRPNAPAWLRRWNRRPKRF